MEENETIKKMFLIINKIEETPVSDWTLDGLVDHTLMLTKFMFNLSDMRNEAILVSEMSAEEYKQAVQAAHIRIKEEESVSDTVAKAKAELECKELKTQELNDAHNMRMLNSLYKDCERLISFVQTKTKSMVDQQVRANIERT